MKTQHATIFVDHSLTPQQIARRIELENKLSSALGCSISLRESTAKWPLTEQQLVERLDEPDWIEFSGESEMPLEVWATKAALAIELLNEKYEWPNVLLQGSSLIVLQTFVDELSKEYGSTHAVIAPSSGPGAGVAREFFAEAISIDELVQRLLTTVGPALGSIHDAKKILHSGDADLKAGYFYL